MADAQIEVIDGISHIRLRPGMYIGPTNDPYHLMQEILDNSLDELSNKYANKVTIDFDQEGTFTITDNGRGIPIHEVTLPNGQQLDSIIAIVTELHSGAKFNTQAYQNSIGLHGVGLVVVNALSSYLTVATKDKKNSNTIHFYTFQDSKFISKQQINTKVDWSTRIEFKVNPEHFDGLIINVERLKRRLQLVASSFPTSKVLLNGELFKNIPLSEFVREYLKIDKDIPIMEISEFSNNETIKAFFTYDITGYSQPELFGDVNLNLCEGTYLTNFSTLFYNVAKDIINEEKISKNDILSNFRCYLSLSISEPKFDGQNKVRMSKNVVKLVNTLKVKLEGNLKNKFFSNHFELLKEEKAVQKAAKVLKAKKARVSTENPLKDCEKIPGKTLYILEGDSAGGTLKQIRNAKTEAIYPLSGKILNVIDKSIDKIIDSKKLKYLFEAIGIDLSKKNQTDYRYDDFKILCDADSISAETEIIYISKCGLVKCDQIQNISENDIDLVFSLNKVTNKCELKSVLRIIKHNYTKSTIKRITTVGGYELDCTDDHVVYVLNLKTSQIEEVAPSQINIETQYLLRSKYLPCLNNDIFIDIKDNVMNQMTNYKSCYILINSNKYNNDLDDSYVKLFIKGKIDLTNINITKICEKLNINKSTMQMYLTGRDNTFMPLEKVKLLSKYIDKDIENVLCKIQYNNDSKHYLNIGKLYGYNGNEIRTLFSISPDLAYLLGQYLGDGCHGSSKNNPYEIIIASGDGKYKDKIIQACINCGFTNIVLDQQNNCLNIKIKSIEFCAILDYFSLSKNIKGKDKFIPNILYSTKSNIRMSLLEGLYNSDGSMMILDNGQYRLNFASTSKKLIDGVILLLKQFGISPLISKRKVGKIGKLVSYNLNINKKYYLEQLKFLDIPKNNAIINNLTYNINKYFEAIKITSIQDIKYNYDSVYDLEVEDNNNFTSGLGGYILHNSDGLHISVLVSIILWKHATQLIKSGRVGIILPPLYGATKGTQFIPIYNQNNVANYKNLGYNITRFKGLGEMNPSQLEVIIRNPIEYTISPPQTIKDGEIIDLCLTEVKLKRRLCEHPDRFNVENLMKLTINNEV